MRKFNISRNNHFVSQMYLEAWQNSNNKVMVYDLLVPDDKVPIWSSKSIRSVASIDSLFVRLNNNIETDDIEKWFATEYESPAKEALNKAINEERISVDEWHKLINFVACHIVRTPDFLVKILETAKRDCAPIFEEEIESISRFSEETIKESIKNMKIDINMDLFPIKCVDVGDDETGLNRLIKVETIFGKQFYLWIMKHLLEKTSKILHKHKWGIITINDKVILPTSDSPVICLNYNNENDYNFGGGWGKENSNIIFPISPNKILYTQVGIKCKPRMKVNYKMSLVFKKIIVEHSYRKVISNFKDEEITKIKPRHIDLKEFIREKEMWDNFQKDYLEKESEYIK
ncbi:MAG: DUF4238 domain-containing protein [Bacilli bacterium]|nr:DUF4238 domain-containing protein [Bacilli bacterium]